MSLRLRISLFIIVLLWNLGIYSEYISTQINEMLSLVPFLKISYSNVCHQQFNKLLEIYGTHSLVCSRCAGIYSGTLISSFLIIIFPDINKIDLKIFMLALLPTLIDVFLVNFGFYVYSKSVAFSVGFILGLIVLLFFANIISIKIKEEIH